MGLAVRPRNGDHVRVSHPASHTPTDPAAIEAVVTTAVAAHAGEPGPLLAILQDVQAELGLVPEAVIRPLADQLNLSRAEVQGVISFYSELRTQAHGEHVVALCRAEACQAVGAQQLVGEVSRRLGVTPQQTRADGAVTLEEVFCFGNCALGPSGTIDGRLYGRLTADRVLALALVAETASGSPSRAGEA